MKSGETKLRAVVVMEYTDENGRVTCAVAEAEEHGDPIGTGMSFNGGYSVYQRAGHVAFRSVLLQLGQVSETLMTEEELRAYTPKSADHEHRSAMTPLPPTLVSEVGTTRLEIPAPRGELPTLPGDE